MKRERKRKMKSYITKRELESLIKEVRNIDLKIKTYFKLTPLYIKKFIKKYEKVVDWRCLGKDEPQKISKDFIKKHKDFCKE